MLTEAVIGLPDPRLRRYVDRYLGYREQAAGPLVRREVAGAFVVLILGWGAPLDVTDPRAGDRGAHATNAFLAVLDRYTLEDLVKPRRSLARLLGIDVAERLARTRP